MLALPIQAAVSMVAAFAKVVETRVCYHRNAPAAAPCRENAVVRDIREGHRLFKERIISFLDDLHVAVPEIEELIPVCQDIDDEFERQFGTLDPSDSLESLLFGVIAIRREAIV